MNYQEAVTAFAADQPRFADYGINFPSARAYTPSEWKRNFQMAMDAQPALVTDPNSGIPWYLTNIVDPEIYKVAFAPTKIATIVSEERKGTWLDDTIMLPVVEHAGEVSAYGDHNENGTSSVNMNWPQRQSFFFQIIKQYGERELERAGLAKINFVSEMDLAAATILKRFENLAYAFGIQGLQNYGLLNDPHLNASLTPATKAAGGVAWIQNGVIVATANEIYLDIETMFVQLVNQTAGLVDRETEMVLAMSPASEAALTATNSFNVNVSDLVKKNFPNLTVETAIQYGVLSATNPQGVAAGNYMQLIAKTVDGQRTAYVAYNEKMRAHPIIKLLSSFKQKQSSGVWGAIVRLPAGISAMIGV